MAIDDFKCPLKEIETIEEWAKKGTTDESCPPCAITPLSGYYLGTLEDAGEQALANELKVAFETGDVLTIARKLDGIKNQVSETLKAELKEYDCFAQVYKDE